MDPLGIVIAVAAAGLVAATVWGFIRRKRSGRSGCDCGRGCSGHCENCPTCRQTEAGKRPSGRDSSD